MRHALSILLVVFFVFSMANVSFAGNNDKPDYEYEKIAKKLGKNELPKDNKITDQWLVDNTGKTFYKNGDIYVIMEGKSRDMNLASDRAKLKARKKLAEMLMQEIDCQNDEVTLYRSSVVKQSLTKDGNQYKMVVLMKLPLDKNL